MNNKYLIIVILAFTLFFNASNKNENLLGTYKMTINNNFIRGYGDYLKIIKIDNTAVRGEVGIDWGIGPEARTPLAWEILYKKPFKTKQDGKNFKFDVLVGENTVHLRQYSFNLRFAKDGLIEGTVTIKNLKVKKESKNAVTAKKVQE